MLKNFKIPDTTILIFLVLIFFAALTWIIPGGEYATKIVNGRTIVIPGSFEYIESHPTSFSELILAPFRGMTDASASQIIAFIFIVAGAFSLIEATGSTTAIIQRAARFFSENPKYEPFFVPSFMTLFSIMGATFGMSEEVIVFIPLFVSLSLALKYDAIVGAAVPFIGAGVGFAGAIINPFTIGIAQGIAEIQVMSGSGFRLIVWVIFTVTGILLVNKYAKSVKGKAGPNKQFDPSTPQVEEDLELTASRKVTLLAFAVAMGLLIYGVVEWGWYIPEISGLFLVLGIFAGIISHLDGKASVNAFIAGMQSVMGAAIVVALSKAILLVLTDAKIIDTILFSLAKSIEGWPNILSAQIMLLVQTCINTVVPSGSGQAALTIPIMAPLGDLVGITRQTVVLIFQFGDGITNLIIPTSGVTMGVLGMANIPWETWAKWLFPKLLLLYALAMLFVGIAVSINYA